MTQPGFLEADPGPLRPQRRRRLPLYANANGYRYGLDRALVLSHRAQYTVTQALNHVHQLLPFPLLRLDAENESGIPEHGIIDLLRVGTEHL